LSRKESRLRRGMRSRANEGEKAAGEIPQTLTMYDLKKIS
jgi:hypothetical protein